MKKSVPYSFKGIVPHFEIYTFEYRSIELDSNNTFRLIVPEIEFGKSIASATIEVRGEYSEQLIANTRRVDDHYKVTVENKGVPIVAYLELRIRQDEYEREVEHYHDRDQLTSRLSHLVGRGFHIVEEQYSQTLYGASKQGPFVLVSFGPNFSIINCFGNTSICTGNNNDLYNAVSKLFQGR